MSSGSEPRSMRLFWLAGFALLIGTLLGAQFVFNSAQGSPTSLSPPENNTRPGIHAMTIGFVDSEFGITNPYPTQLGRIVDIRPEGFRAKKGDWLIKIDDRLAKFRLREAEAVLKQAEKLPEQHQLKLAQQALAIEAAQHEKKAADLNLAISKRSMDKGIADAADAFASGQELVKRIDCKVKAEQSKLSELKLADPMQDLKRSQATYDQAKLAVTECEMVAPSDGTLLRSLVHVGEVVGSNPKFPPIQFVPDGKKIIRAEILQEWAGRFKEGQNVTIVDDTYTGPEWHGTITRISDWYSQKRHIIFEPFTLNDARSLECIIEVTDKDAPLRIGQRVRIGVIK